MLPPSTGEAFPPSKGEALIAALRSAETPKARARARYRASDSLFAHPDKRVRLALAEHYRAHGTPSQAARWGITAPGWATPAEVRELRHWLLGRVDENDYVRDLLRIRSDRPVPEEVADLVDPALLPPHPQVKPPSDGAGCALVIIAILALLVAIAGAFSAFVRTIFGGEDLTSTARIDLVVAGVAFIVAVVTGGMQWLLDRRHRPARAYADDRGFGADAQYESPSTDPLFITTLAWRLADAGDPAAAHIVLRAALTRNLSDRGGARRALLELSRASGHRAEAGRWGIGVPGATTASERDAYARLLAPVVGPIETTLRVRSVIGADQRLTDDAHDVLRRVYRIRMRHSGPADGFSTAEEGGREAPWNSSLYDVRGVPSIWWAWPAGAFAIGALVSAALAALGSPAATAVARWCTAAVAAALGLLLIAEGVAAARSPGPRRSAITHFALGGVFIVGAVVFGFLLATGNA